nr:hypothetical protein [Tanacetum cinerariifolium]
TKATQIKISQKELETLKKEKERVDSKLAGFLTTSKDLDNLIESQRSDKNKEGLGYSAVPPPPPAQIYSSPKKDLLWTRLPEFADDTVTDYSRPFPTMESTSGRDFKLLDDDNILLRTPRKHNIKNATSQEVKKDVSSLRYIALPNWAHDALLESSLSKHQDHCSTEVPESSGNTNPTTSTSNPPADQMETLTMESPIPTVSSPVPTAYSTNSQEPSMYKVEKAMYGLHQAPRAWYGTLSKYLLTNGFQMGTINQTLFIRRQRGYFILVQVYVDDIIFGSSNPQLCREVEALMHEKFQRSAMDKRIFRYLKGHPKLGLWYPKESPFDLVEYSDSDYGGATQDHKSTTGGCQFLGRRLISWQCKKQTIVATSTTGVEYVAAASCSGQVL